MFQVKKLRCEYMDNPIGIGVTEPRISWQLHSDQRGVMQSAYHIEVAKDIEFNIRIWDSGKVESEQSVHVELQGLVVESCIRYYYRVQAWDEKGAASGWSEPAYWEMGLLTAEEWKADWIIAPTGLFEEESEQCPLLRSTFEVQGKVKSARIYATSLGLYELELNGVRVGDSYFTPGWTSYQTRLQVQTYDVTDLIASGSNAVCAALGNGWYKGNIGWREKNSIYGEQIALLLQIHITYEDGTTSTIVTDRSWRASGSPILMSEIYHGETYDARLEQDGWSTAGFTDTDWSPVEILDYSKEQLVAQENEPVRKIEELKPISLITTPKGEIVIDMGQNMIGWVKFAVRGQSGQEVQLLHAEVLDQEGNFYIENLRSAKQTIRYILKGDVQEVFEPHFTFQGFRYVQLIGFEEPISLDDFTGIVLHSDMEQTGQFECSEPLVNQLQHNILWGQKGNFLDVPTDCPQRDERLGWTGDAQMFINTASYLMNVAPFFSKWLKDLKADQYDNGGVPFVIPHVLKEKDHSSAAWGDAAVICPWTIYQAYGDKRVLDVQFESMKAWVEYIRSQGEQEYLWNTGFHFGDWLGLDAKPDSYVGATDRDFIATAFYAYSTQLLAKSAKILGKTADFETYQELYGNIKLAFQEEFVTPTGRLSVPTQTANVLALMFGLLDGAAKERAVRKLMQLLEENKFHLTTGFVGTPYLNLVLSRFGQNEAAYKLLFQQDYPSWLYQVTKGATTIWEHWDGIKEDGSFWSKHMNSFNHYAYGAIGDWLYRCVAGIDTTEEQPGYKNISISPQPGSGLTWAKGQLESMYGLIASQWQLSEEGLMTMLVKIPPNTTASVHLPGAKESDVLEGGVVLSAAAGICGVQTLESGLMLTLGSGEYQFTFTAQ
jgi:alpha-L-rhamnosidase